MPALFISLMTFLLTTALVYAAAEAWARPGRRLHVRLGAVVGPGAERPNTEQTLGLSGERPDALPTVTGWLGGSAWERRLRLAMIRADLRLRPAEWLTACAVSAAGLSLAGLLLSHSALFGLLLGGLGLTGPLLILQIRQDARQRKFEAQTPDMLLLLTASLRAGHSFSQAMALVASEMPPPTCTEFAWASGETALGAPLETALGRMLARVPSPDLDLIVTAILIQLPLGGNLAEVLAVIAETIRERVRVQGEVRTLTAEGRLSALVLIVLAPALALLLHARNPAYFQPLLETALGRGLLAEAVLGQIVGGLLVRAMVRLDV